MFRRVFSVGKSSEIQRSLSLHFKKVTQSDLGGISYSKAGFGQKIKGSYFKVLLKITYQRKNDSLLQLF